MFKKLSNLMFSCPFGCINIFLRPIEQQSCSEDLVFMICHLVRRKIHVQNFTKYFSHHPLSADTSFKFLSLILFEIRHLQNLYVCMYVRTYSCSRYRLETSCMDSSWKNSRRVFLVFPELSPLVKLRPFHKQGDEIL